MDVPREWGLSRARAPSRVPAVDLVQLLEAVDEGLDPGLGAHQLGRGRRLAAEDLAQHGVEEQHRRSAERPVRPARLQEMDGGTREPPQADLPGHGLHEGFPTLVERFERQAHEPGSSSRCASSGSGATPSGWPGPTDWHGSAWRIGREGAGSPSDRACAKASYAAAPRRAKMTCSIEGDPGSSSRTAVTAIRAASSSGNPPMPVPSAGKAMLPRLSSRARAIAFRAARSIAGPLVRRSRSRDTAWMTTRAARLPAAFTIASPSATGAWRRAANSTATPA